jgi:molecular chaperone HtpG
MTPIWKKRKGEVEQKDYDEFYKSTFHDWEKPARTISFHAEGAISATTRCSSSRARHRSTSTARTTRRASRSTSSNVLIQEKCADLLPDYYNFVRGVVDSPDVTLNISRETLQQNAQLRAIARRVEKKITSELEDMRDNDREAYEKFFDNFGRGLKFGIYNSYGSKADELADLLLFWSRQAEQVRHAQGVRRRNA